MRRGHVVLGALAARFTALVLRITQDSDLEEFFYPDLKPYEHYIPIKRDFSDLETQAPPSVLLWVAVAVAVVGAAEVAAAALAV